MRIARQDTLFELLLGGNIRQVSQIRSHHDRTDHLHYVRLLRAGRVLSTVGASALLGLFCAIALGEKRHGDAEEAKHRST